MQHLCTALKSAQHYAHAHTKYMDEVKVHKVHGSRCCDIILCNSRLVDNLKQFTETAKANRQQVDEAP